jgi:E3 ubiquitin-protein ligase RGLG
MGQESSKSSRRSSSQRYSDSGSSVPSNQRLQKTFSKKYSFIPDRYKTLEQVQQSLRDAGLESSNLIVGIDLTKSNEWTGKVSFQGRSLHALGNVPNPYEQATSIIGRTLADFDDDNLIPCYGFGDGTTHDQHVFSFFPGDRPCQGFEEALARYRTIIPHVKLAGPTSFAPIIDRAVGIVEASGGQYHILLIIADGQVTRSVDMADGELSPQEQATVNSIVNASNYPLSIVLVGVGDGPWDMMKEFDDNLPQRRFDNFQFVEFNRVMAKSSDPFVREAQFALTALMEIPSQYKAAMELGLLGHRTGAAPMGAALPPPPAVLQIDAAQGPPTPPPQSVYPPFTPYAQAGPSAPPPPPARTPQEAAEQNLCPICLTESKDMAFQCGHQTCRTCGETLQNCPMCRERIKTRIRLF